jgi:hypothetical protein
MIPGGKIPEPCVAKVGEADEDLAAYSIGLNNWLEFLKLK